MTTKIEELKTKRDQLSARIQKAESRDRATRKKQDDRVKVLVGAAVLETLKGGKPLTVQGVQDLLGIMDAFLSRESEQIAVLGENGKGSSTLHRLTTPADL